MSASRSKRPRTKDAGMLPLMENPPPESTATSSMAAEAAVRDPASAPEGAQEQPIVGNVLLHTEGLKKVYDGRAVVNGVDIEVKEGEIVGLLGPNGAGKTTTFYMIVGLVRPNGGKVMFNGNDATQEPMFKRARLGMGYLPQEESIFRRLTVRENILAVMETQSYTKKEREDQCQQLMEKFGIDHVADNLALTLSGGEKRRLTIARSLVTEPKLLMLDEPFSGVDPIAVSEIQDIIRMLRKAGLAILITDHNVRETLNIVDRAYLIYEGQVRRHGTKDFLVNDPESRRLYLGEDFSM
ncbi:lipopolysaccharide export system ATP-binding protein [Prosthecobacter debontii]|uniref:Lipopolysaccharide export system ATP-binding protein n=1 Tax=Prosthecobacter debontii TaxID=48467 RepID=A0A1T4YSW6_9BACT|nr:LPS export ABC transporter ATP-binding protein [Prosthecobacter debontii]SKB04842.1 lipopolysaccharide export system ATP-binding protein [Prosthecobacter debontii]